jgi:hypothetical protein
MNEHILAVIHEQMIAVEMPPIIWASGHVSVQETAIDPSASPA